MFADHCGTDRTIKIEVFESVDDLEKIERNLQDLERVATRHNRVVIVFSISIPYRTDAELKTWFASGTGTMQYDPETARHLHSVEVLQKVEDRVRCIAIAANIARFGSLNIQKLQYFQGSNLLIQSAGTGAFLDRPESFDTLGWPKLVNLKLKEVLLWLDEVPGVAASVSETALGRAIAAFTHLLHGWGKDSLSLVWGVMGLEALYATGSIGLRNQIIERSQAVLGDNPAPRLLGKIYDFRSRLVHGDKNVPFAFNGSDVGNAGRFRSTLHDYESFVLVILVATLQFMCQKHLFELRFRSVLDEIDDGV